MNLKLLSLLAAAAITAGPAFAFTRVGISFRVGVPAPVIVHRAPPRHAVEIVAASPGPGYVWVGGHYTWTGAEWAWVPGQWVMPPQAGTVWIEPRWDAASQNWIAGHWEVRQAVVVAPPPPAVVTAPAGEVIIRTAPPPLRRERHGHRPGPNYVWVDGYWAWQGGHHVWIGGRWAVPPHRHAVWVAPRWERRGGTYVFIQGNWR
ncbi:MAG TPA: YXWGXW repeat-containing protein [Opitutus sp.]|nr:YXWGXW repeat-containing protein [Opitutus sp.]